MKSNNKIPSEVKKLMKLINDTFDLDIMSRSRQTKYIKARILFASLLKERVYGCLAIGKMLKKNHATILNYFKSFDWFLKTDTEFYTYHLVIEEKFKDMYLKFTELNEIELKKELILLRQENKSLYLENKELKLQLNDASLS